MPISQGQKIFVSSHLKKFSDQWFHNKQGDGQRYFINFYLEFFFVTSFKWIIYIGEGYAITPVTAIVITYLPWPPWAYQCINRNNPICVALPKVAKASTIHVAVASIIAGVITLTFANGNTA